VWTKDSLYVARPTVTTVIDTIPLDEIHAVMEMNEEPEPLKSTQQSLFNRLKSNVHTERRDEAEDSAEDLEATLATEASHGSAIFSRSTKKNCILQVSESP
jgi:hypothetical protein